MAEIGVRISMDCSTVRAALGELSAALEEVSSEVLDELFPRFNSLLARLSDCELVAATATGKGVIGLQLPASWEAELLAIAADARQRKSLNVHGGLPVKNEEILAELKAIRALLERQTAVQAWSAGLQRDPFTPSPSEAPQALAEARFAHEASLQSLRGFPSIGCGPKPGSSQCARSLHECSGSAESSAGSRD